MFRGHTFDGPKNISGFLHGIGIIGEAHPDQEIAAFFNRGVAWAFVAICGEGIMISIVLHVVVGDVEIIFFDPSVSAIEGRR